MKSRVISVALALVLGLLAAVAAAVYLGGAKREIDAGAQPVEVLVAKEDIPKGTSSEEITTRSLAEKRRVPLTYVAQGAISTMRSVEGQVLSVPLARGGQLTGGWFQYPSDAGLACSVPRNLLAMTIPVDNVKGVAGLVKPGDRVAVFATFSPGASGKDTTKILLPSAHVLAVDRRTGGETQQQSDDSQGNSVAGSASGGDSKSISSVTLALSAVNAQKLVFAEEKGKVWLALLPATQSRAQAGRATTLQTVAR